MRLVHVVASPDSLSFFTGQLRYMVEKGLDVHVASAESSALRELARREGVTAHALTIDRGISPGRDLVSVVRLQHLLQRLRPDIVHAHMTKAGLVGMLASKAAGTRVRIYHNQGMALLASAGLRRRLLFASERISCGLASRVLCASRSVAEAAVNAGVCDAGKIGVLGAGGFNGVDSTHRFNPGLFDAGAREKTRANLAIPAGAKVVGFVGRLAQAKGPDELVRTWRGLREVCPAAHLVVVGGVDDREPAAIEDLEALSTDSRVHLTGRADDVASAYAIMDVAVLPSRYEGLPNVALEAAAMEVPMVATRIAGTVDAISDGITGTLVAPGHSEALVGALRRYLETPSLGKQHGAAARARVVELFQPSGMWKALLEEYRRLAAEVDEREVGS